MDAENEKTVGEKETTTFDDFSKDFDTIVHDETSEDDANPSDEIDEDDKDTESVVGADDSPEATSEEVGELGVLGWDKDTIAAVEKINPKIMEDIKALIKGSEISTETEVKAEAKTVDKESIKTELISGDELKVLKEKLGNEAGAVIESLLQRTKSLEDSLSVTLAERETESRVAKEAELVADFNAANKKMDELAKDFPILGTLDKLPKDKNGVLDMRNRCVRERESVWNFAEALKAHGVVKSFDEALDEAVHWYRGKNGENLAMRKVVTDLNKNKKKFTSRPTHKHTKGKDVDPNSAAGKEATMAAIFEEVGIKD